MVVELVSHSPEETAALGRWLGERLWPGSFVALVGDLGAGKSVLAAGILSGLGVVRSGGSPTFTLLWEYRRGRVPAFHWDLYRLDPAGDLAALGYEDSFYGDGVCIVEWADRARDLWPPEHLEVQLAAVRGGAGGPGPDAGAAERRLTFRPAGARYERLVEELRRAHAGL
ncbi:tRNA (adenosine(37)-N6)-threonylcarbamoyltransferase complex ATPase subunit type 1 TsaE [Caldinitratiruptor microaerophilus]|uniref:tRNA threonylcarbamoyladenosine biosynthesis protein TsaE n=1 Tax=Caldinitratiruptor microaerophilus TaxID=671077 RepID=A0AA35CNL9_9FIRM|nr:tRNA (adenosine(37)-N6)-threonylcarbamoyltransferase complex ATPase subunit type 1 TsaE [Caldinitratiruptor microaerophilus]